MSSIDNKLTVLYDTIIIIIGVTFIINFISNEDESNQLKFVNITAQIIVKDSMTFKYTVKMLLLISN